jgi:hypothetical protein
MFKFLKKIRYKLLEDNNTRKYLKYAVGEIVLVMVGILLALQVNNWNEYLKDRKKEKHILIELHKDFKKNLESFVPVKTSQTNTLKSGEIVFRNIHKLHLESARDSVFKHTTNMFGGYSYHPSNGVVESLISSGDFNLISNDTLRKYLVSWNDVLTNYADNVKIDVELWSNMIEPYVIHHGDFLHLASDKNKALLVDPIFVNMMVRKQFFQQNIVNAIHGGNGLEHYLEEIVRLTATD